MAAVLCGQSVTGTITGLVKDPQDAAIPRAEVRATNVDTGAEASIRTQEEGFYRLSNLLPGEYRVEITAPGFRKVSFPALRVSVQDALRLDASLEIGEVAEAITVEAVATQVNTDDSQLGKTVREIPQLPLLSGANGRSPILLALTLPGVGNFINSSQPGNFSVNGQRFYANNFIFDGADANNQVVNAADVGAAMVSPNAVAEFRLVTGAMKAEFGRNPGATVIVTTRSGGNSFHGVASETLRNTRLNAAPFFQKAVPGGTPRLLPDGTARNPQWNSNDFDANLGGPLRKDKTFFFVSYLGFRRRQGAPRSAVVPSDSQRAAIEAQGRPEARALLALIPRATFGNTLLSSPSNSLNRDQGLARIDHALSNANRFSATYFIEDSSNLAPFPSSAVPGFGAFNDNRLQNAVARDTHAFSPALFHDLRLAFHRFATNNLVPQNRTRLSSLGLGKIIPDDPAATEGPPWVVLAGFDSFGNTFNGPQAYKTTQYQVVDNVSWSRGRHLVKFGGDFRTFAMNTTFYNSPNGQISIDGSGTSTGVVSRVIPALPPVLNDFANGFASSFTQTSSARVGHRSRSVSFFAQDDWKVSPSLALNFGLRWDFIGAYHDVRDRIVTLRVGQQSTVFPGAPRGLVYPGDPGVPRSTYSDDYNNFSPRFGFAWDVRKNGRLSVRGGYGLFYETPFEEILFGASLFSPPFAIRPATVFTEYADPWAGSRVKPIPQPFPHQPAKPGDRVDFTQFAPVGFTFLDPAFRAPYGQQWNLQVQYALRKEWLLEVGYVGSNGVKLSNEREYNYSVPAPGASGANVNQRRILNLGNPQNAAYGGAVFGSVFTHTGNANSNYNALQVHLTRRMARGFQMSHAYTWSHNIDNASGRRVSSRFDPRQDRGNSDQDLRHRYALSFIYELPLARDRKGAAGRLLAGWGVSGIATLQSGLRASIVEPQDRCLCSTGNQRVDFVGPALQFFDPRSTTAVPGRPNSWFDGTGGGSATGAPNPYFRRVGSGPSFALGAGRYGNLGRNTVLMPGVNNWQLAAFKGTRITEAQSLEFRAEFFNAFNHTQILFPNLNIGSPNFGIVTGTLEPRIVQLGLRLSF